MGLSAFFIDGALGSKFEEKQIMKIDSSLQVSLAYCWTSADLICEDN